MGKMTKKTCIRYIFIFLAILIAQPIFSKNLPLNLISNNITYNKISGFLIASGNVEVYFENLIITTQELKYDSKLNEISITGAFTIQDGENLINSNNDAIIDTKLKIALITSARAIIDNQLQVSSKKSKLNGNGNNEFYAVAASSCTICKNNPVPFWQIRATRIVHNKDKQKIYFKNAKLDFLGLPIMYVPNLSVPEPNVTRARGFLVPKLSSSNKNGISIKIPYYFTIGDHKDFTITPFITSQNDIILENEYRQETSNGFFEISNAISIKENLNFGKYNGFIKGEGAFAYNYGYNLDFKIYLTNKIDFKNGEKPFINNYNYAKIENNQLKNSFDIHKATSNSYFQIGSSFIQSFKYRDFNNDGVDEEDPNVPFIFPEMYFKQNYNDFIFDTKFSISTHFVNLTNVSSGKYSRLSENFYWNKNLILRSGLNWKMSFELNTNTYLNKNKIYFNTMPLGMIETRYPIEKKLNGKSHLIEPIIQLIKSPNKPLGDIITKGISDSTTAEFEDTNLFSTNRFPGSDVIEAGLRANIGGRYIFHDPNGWKFTSTFGRVFREKNLNQFNTSVSTGLDKLNSDYVSSIILKTPNKLSFSSKLLFDGKFNVTKNETNLNFINTNYNLNLNYVWLDKQSILNLNSKQHEVNVGLGYVINDYLRLDTHLRQNLNTNSPIIGGFNMIYKNECTEIDFSLDLEYDEDREVDKIFGIQLFLTGFGNNSKQEKFINRCTG
jgi:LPS-assembly protein